MVFMIEVALLLLGVAMIALCGLFVAAEFSFVALDRPAVGDDRRLLGVLRHLSLHLSAAQIGITITNLIIGYLAEPSLSQILRGPLGFLGSSVDEVAFLLAFVIANALTIVFGELVPKNLAISRPLQTARGVAGFQVFFSKAISPLLHFAQNLSNRILLRFGIEPQEELASIRSAEELSSLVRRSAEKGTLEEPTAQLLDLALQFRLRNAEDAMTPRSQVQHLHPEDTLEDLVEISKETGHSRFPVLRDSEICGVVHLRHAIALPPEKRSVSVERFCRDPLLVPSSFPLHQLMDRLRGGMQIALVVDEWGSFDGVLTLEDLVEEMVGEVQDEHDQEDIAVRRIRKDSWEFSGRLRPDEVFRKTGVRLPEGDWESVAGLLLYHLQAIPSGKERVLLPAEDSDHQSLQVELLVNRMDGLRIDRVHMRVIR